MGNRKGTQSEQPKRDIWVKCLWCLEYFWSYGKQNRQCPRCKHSARARGYQQVHYHDTNFEDGEVHHRVTTHKTAKRQWE